MRRNHTRRLVALILGLLLLAGCSWISHPKPQSTTLSGTQGGTIVYGVVAGAAKPAAGLASVLLDVQNSCGEKPQVGNVFRVKGSHSDAVYFTVVDHPQNNRQAAGMVIAVQTGPKTVEAAMVTDDAARFSSTMNPLLTQLFGVWHPGAAQAAASGALSAGNAASGQQANPYAQMGADNSPGGQTANPYAQMGAGNAPGGDSTGSGGATGAMPTAFGGGGVPPMQQVMLPDRTASLSVPAGWNIDPQKSGGGSTVITGPQGEYIAMEFATSAMDPRGQGYQNMMRMRMNPPHTVVLQSDLDMTKSYVNIWQAIRASVGMGPAPMTLSNVQQVPGQEGQCVDATGQINPDGRGMKEMRTLLCRMPPDQNGMYSFRVSGYQLPLGASDQQRATANAIMASYNVDVQRVQAMSNAQVAPLLAQFQQHQQALMSFTQSQIAHTQQIGANARAQMQATEAANQQQWAGFDKQEANISRQGQGFSNYLLDQSVVQNNNVNGTGMVGHATLWNTQANALVQANPNKYELVPQSNYWSGTDFNP